MEKPFSVTRIHLAGWFLFFCLPLVFVAATQPQRNHVLPLLGSWQYWECIGLYVIIFYLHTYWLIPQCLHKRRLWLYLPAITSLIVLVTWLQPFDHLLDNLSIHHELPPFPDPQFMQPPYGGMKPPPGDASGRHGPAIDIVSEFVLLLTLAGGFAIELVRQWKVATEKAARAEAGKAQAELAFLKSQINPHFLFNTLNNIYVMAVSGDAHTANAVLKLSGIMRYVTDEAAEELVPLEKEISCITDYIDLQRLRLNNKVMVQYQVTGDPARYTIPPLLLMTFVENVFKYGISTYEETVVRIEITATSGLLQLHTRNKIWTRPTLEERSGIGLTNARKRLESLYSHHFVLNITDDDGHFTVNLSITYPTG